MEGLYCPIVRLVVLILAVAVLVWPVRRRRGPDNGVGDADPGLQT